MYLSFYNLSKKPFTISADPRFLWQGEKHKEAFANLKYGLLDLNGYVVLTGDVGTGKTTLVNALIEMLDDSVYTANINHPTLDTLDFFRLIAKAYDPSAEITNKAEFLLFLNAFLQQSHKEGKVVLLIIDEAHRLSKELLEEIRLFSNIEQDGVKLINIFFVGQDEFKEIIQWPECRALRQRITLFYDLEPLTEKETLQYVEHRLEVAGANGQIFTPEALRRVYKFTKGCPRLINILCDRALLTGYIKEQRNIDTAILKECSQDLRFHHLAKTKDSSPGGNRRKLISIGLAVVLALILIGVVENFKLKPSIEENVSPHPASVVADKHSSSRASLPAAALPQLPEKVTSIQSEEQQDSSSPASPIKILAKASKEQPQPTKNEAKAPPKPAVVTAAERVTTGVSSPQAATVPQALNNKGRSGSKEDIKQTVKSGSKTPEQQTAEIQQESSPLVSQDQVLLKASQKEPQLTVAELAAAAIEQGNFLKGIELLEAHEKKNGGSDIKTRELYSKALVGRAEQVGLTIEIGAERLLLKAVEVNPGSVDAYYDLGKMYTDSKNYTLAIESYQNAIRLNPKLADAFFNLGYIYATNRDYKAAEKQFLQVVHLAPGYQAKALFNLALVQKKLGKREECVANLRKAVILDPENRKAQEYLEHLLGTTERNQQ